MVVEGTEIWKGGMNEKISVTFSEEGLHGYRCRPHYGMGMIGLVQVGNAPVNLAAAAAVKHPGRAKSRAAELLALVNGDGTDIATGE